MTSVPGAVFEFATATRIVFGANTVRQLPSLLGGRGRRVFVLTGKETRRHATVLDALAAEADAHVSLFAVPREPSVTMLERALAAAREHRTDTVVALGGGSAIDTGKAVAALLAHPDAAVLDHLEVVGKGLPLSARPLPFIAVPTTAGTGAEVTKNGVFVVESERVKVSMRSPLMLPAVALVDPTLCLGVPRGVTVATGCDAFCQVLEAFVSCKANPITDALARDALARVRLGLLPAVRDGDDLGAREHMCVVSLCGGLCLANAKLGAVHGFAGPLGGMYTDAAHGHVCAALLAPSLRVNVAALRARDPHSPALAKLDECGRLLTARADACADDAVRWIDDACAEMRVPRLREYGLREDDFALVCAKAARASSMQGNPIKLTDDELLTMLKAAY